MKTSILEKKPIRWFEKGSDINYKFIK